MSNLYTTKMNGNDGSANIQVVGYTNSYPHAINDCKDRYMGDIKEESLFEMYNKRTLRN